MSVKELSDSGTAQGLTPVVEIHLSELASVDTGIYTHKPAPSSIMLSSSSHCA